MNRILKLRESVSKKDFIKSSNEKRVENWKEKQMYWQFLRDIPQKVMALIEKM